MTFEEIREMVNATITENGQRQITGKALNLALLEIITAIEENKPEGGAAETVYIGEPLHPEHQAVNAATYAKCKANVAEDKALPAIVMDVTQMMAAQGMPTDGVKAAILPQQVLFVDPSSPYASSAGMEGLVCAHDDGSSVIVNEDGSIAMMQ